MTAPEQGPCPGQPGALIPHPAGWELPTGSPCRAVRAPGPAPAPPDVTAGLGKLPQGAVGTSAEVSPATQTSLVLGSKGLLR